MGLFSWFTSTPSPSSTQPTPFSADARTTGSLATSDTACDSSITPENIATFLSTTLAELEKTRHERDALRLENTNMRKTLKASDAKLAHVSSELNKSIEKRKDQTAHIKMLEAEKKGLIRARGNRERDLDAKQNQLVLQLRQTTASLGQKELHIAELWKRCDQLKWQNEWLQCVGHNSQEKHVDVAQSSLPVDDSGTLISSSTELIPQPFVVVLIDGDAYRGNWTSPSMIHAANACGSDPHHLPSPLMTPGGLSAASIQNQVNKHILSSPQIPNSARVVTKVFVNERCIAARAGLMPGWSMHNAYELSKFRLQFTQTKPLFDYIDVGGGKERADEKIRENFSLYIANPYCHAIYLAVCFDNGFARMLEPVLHHPVAYEKITLVAAGWVETEITNLGFKTVEWPTVFRNTLPPAEVRRARERNFQRRIKEVEELRVFEKAWGLTGIVNEAVRVSIYEMTTAGDADLGGMVMRWSRGVGLRRSSGHEQRSQPSTEDRESDSNSAPSDEDDAVD